MLTELCNFTNDESEFFHYSSHGHTQEEIAEMMNVSVSTIKRISKRVKNKIHKILLK